MSRIGLVGKGDVEGMRCEDDGGRPLKLSASGSHLTLYSPQYARHLVISQHVLGLGVISDKKKDIENKIKKLKKYIESRKDEIRYRDKAYSK